MSRRKTWRNRDIHRPGRFPMLFPVEYGPWETKDWGPVRMRVRRAPRWEADRRRFVRAWAVFAEHFGEETGVYWLMHRLAALIGEEDVA